MVDDDGKNSKSVALSALVRALEQIECLVSSIVVIDTQEACSQVLNAFFCIIYRF